MEEGQALGRKDWLSEEREEGGQAVRREDRPWGGRTSHEEREDRL